MSDVRGVRAFLRSCGFAPMSWSDRYATWFQVAMLGLVLAQPVTELFESLGGQVDPSRLGAGVALLALAYGGFLAAARSLGPVTLPAADAAWLVFSPLSRRGVLGRTSTILVAVSVVAGAVLGLGMLAVLGVPDQLAPRLVVALVLGISATAGGMASAVLAQASPAWDTWLQGAITVAVLVAVVAALLGAGSGRHLLVSVADAPSSFGAASAAVAASVSAFLVRRAWVALGRIHARVLITASTRFGGVANAVTALDPSSLTWIAEDNHWRGRTLRSHPWPAPLTRARSAEPFRGTSAPGLGPLTGTRSAKPLRNTPTPGQEPLTGTRSAKPLRNTPARGLGPLTGPLALAWHDWRRLGRRPGRAAALLGSAALPGLVAQAGGGFSPVVLIVLLGGAFAAAASCCTGERRDADEPALARLLGVDVRPALAARMLLPALVSAVWLALALAGLTALGVLHPGSWWLFAPLCAPALAAGALRMARRPPVDHSTPVLDTVGGGIPLGPLLWAITGADIAALGCAPLLYALGMGSPTLASGLAAQAVTGLAVPTLFVLRAARRRS